MKNLRRNFNIFCYRNRDKGIPNLMLYIAIGSAIVYLMSNMTGNAFLYNLLCFDRTAIIHGQIWRLVTYPLTYSAGSILLTALSLFVYYTLGRSVESVWGTLKFNLFYFTGVVMMDIYCMIFGGRASVTYLNLSLFLAYATMYPDAQFLLFFVIPVKAWIFALFDLSLVVLDFLTMPFPANLFPIISLANYFLFFGPEVANVLPRSWRIKAGRKLKRKKTAAPRQEPKVIQFTAAPRSQEKQNYTHRCTVCGRTDVSNPELEFRYCSRCAGYYCYCEEHISSHTHIQ